MNGRGGVTATVTFWEDECGVRRLSPRARGSSGVSRARRCPWKPNMSNSRNKDCKQEELGEGGEAWVPSSVLAYCEELARSAGVHMPGGAKAGLELGAGDSG